MAVTLLGLQYNTFLGYCLLLLHLTKVKSLQLRFSAFPWVYSFVLRSCKLMDGFITPSLPPFFLFKALLNSRAPWLHERYLASRLLHAHPPPSHLQFISRVSVIEPTLLQQLSRWGEQGFSSCLVSPIVSSRHYHPAEVFIRFSPFSHEHVVFALRLRARPSRLITFEATYVFVSTTT